MADRRNGCGSDLLLPASSRRKDFAVSEGMSVPGTAMFNQASRDFAIAMEKSYMDGDRASDILAGQNMGLKTILVESGYGTKRLEQPVAPDQVVKDLRNVAALLPVW